MSNTFAPIKVGENTLSNRIVLPPLTRMRAPDHVPHELTAEYYRQRATTPGSLLIAESAVISPQAGGFELVPGIWSKEQINAWKKVTDAVHKEKSFIYCQLWALGRLADASVLEKEGPYPVVAPSLIAKKEGALFENANPNSAKPKALTKDDIKEYVQWFVDAAKNSIEAGFDGVEIHGANGFLLDQFLHENANNRTDEYGGSIENRSRFTLEIVDAVVEAVGAERTGIRLSPWGEFGDMNPGVSAIPQFGHLVSELEKRAQDGNRLSYIHLVEPRVEFWGDSYDNIPRHLNNFVRDIWQGIIIRAGGFGKDFELIKKMQTEDDKLLIAIGRLFISNPDLREKIRDNKPLDLYNRKTFVWHGGSTDPAIGYTKDVVRQD